MSGLLINTRTAIFVLLYVFMANTLAADLVVIMSTVNGITAGDIVDGDAVLELPEGELTLVSASGKTIKLKGPYSGNPDPGQSDTDNTLVESLAKIVSSTTYSNHLATHRNISGEKSKVWAINVDNSGTHCIHQDTPVSLIRTNPQFKIKLTVSTVSGTERESSSFNWKKHRLTYPWPESLRITGDSIIEMQYDEYPNVATVTIRLIPLELFTDAHIALWMFENDCMEQAAKLLVNL